MPCLEDAVWNPVGYRWVSGGGGKERRLMCRPCIPVLVRSLAFAGKSLWGSVRGR